jgi:NAD(P)-dependent dehydrogenase (short-subunit alcohol dehydrogenase family)
MEIIDNLRNHFKALQNYNGDKDDVVERLASIKTLNGLAEWIINSIPAGDPYFVANDTEVVKEKKEESSFKLQRITIECVPTTLNKNNEIPFPGKKLGIAGYESTKVHSIIDKLKQIGIAPNVVSDKDNLEQYDGLIFFDLTSCYNKQSINSLFSIIKKLDNSKVRWVYIFTDYKSHVSQNNIESLYRIQGYPGFIKSLNKEWNAKCRIVHIDTNIPDTDIAEMVAEELLSDDVSTEIYYKESKRQTPKLTNTALVKDKSSFDLPPDSVILVFGGAQGITSEIVIEMAKEYPCHYILVGRTILEPADGYIAYRSILDKDFLRKKILSTKKFNTPKELENYVNKQYKQNQIEYTIDAVRERGCNATYLSADLTDNQSLKNLFEEIHRKYDRIDGVIHAAGYLSDKLLINKTKSMFDQVYNTKVNPLRFLHKNINPDLKFLVFFSSISSVLGNKGQVDYSAANSVMDDYAFELQRILNIKSIAINWGPWNGKGMVSKELENDFLRRGLTSIPIKEGVKAFMDELKFGHENQVIIIAPVTKK